MKIHENVKNIDMRIVLKIVVQNNVQKMKYLTFLAHICETIQKNQVLGDCISVFCTGNVLLRTLLHYKISMQ